VEIDVVDDDASGAIDVSALAARLDSHVRLVCVTHVPTSGGLVNPIAEIGKVTQAAGIPYLVDACQSAGQLPLDVEAIGCDALSATGRKFLSGPRGTGFLYVKRERIAALEPPFLDLRSATWTSPDTYEIRSDARRFETWESSVATRLGLGAAVDHALGWGLDAIAARVGGLASRLRDGLQAIAPVHVHDRGSRQCGIVTFTVDGYTAGEVTADLTAAGINTWVSAVESAQLDLGQRGLPDVVRASVHYFNTDHELEAVLARVDALPRR
jgi:selenocysteine lyase/cysteine desulfurase